MPYTSTPTTSTQIALDADAMALAAKLIGSVAAAYQPTPRRVWLGSQPQPPAEVVDLAYVLTGAARVGLNRWTLKASPKPDPKVFEFQKGTGIRAVAVDLDHNDLARADALSDTISVPAATILSCAICTGLAMLAGDHAIHGPFEV